MSHVGARSRGARGRGRRSAQSRRAARRRGHDASPAVLAAAPVADLPAWRARVSMRDRREAPSVARVGDGPDGVVGAPLLAPLRAASRRTRRSRRRCTGTAGLQQEPAALGVVQRRDDGRLVVGPQGPQPEPAVGQLRRPRDLGEVSHASRAGPACPPASRRFGNVASMPRMTTSKPVSKASRACRSARCEASWRCSSWGVDVLLPLDERAGFVEQEAGGEAVGHAEEGPRRLLGQSGLLEQPEQPFEVGGHGVDVVVGEGEQLERAGVLVGERAVGRAPSAARSPARSLRGRSSDRAGR